MQGRYDDVGNQQWHLTVVDNKTVFRDDGLNMAATPGPRVAG